MTIWGFQDKIANFLTFFCPSIPKIKENSLGYKENIT